MSKEKKQPVAAAISLSDKDAEEVQKKYDELVRSEAKPAEKKVVEVVKVKAPESYTIEVSKLEEEEVKQHVPAAPVVVEMTKQTQPQQETPKLYVQKVQAPETFSVETSTLESDESPVVHLQTIKDPPLPGINKTVPMRTILPMKQSIPVPESNHFTIETSTIDEDPTPPMALPQQKADA